MAVGISLTGHRRLSLHMLALYGAGTLLAVARPAALYALMATQALRWGALVQWWRAAVAWPDALLGPASQAPEEPHFWSDALLFGVVTTVVHEGLYFGACVATPRRQRALVQARRDCIWVTTQFEQPLFPQPPSPSCRNIAIAKGPPSFWAHLLHAVLYFALDPGVNGLYRLCDTKGWLAAYKIPRTPAQAPVPPQLFQATIRGALVGGLLLQVPFSTLLYVARGIVRPPCHNAHPALLMLGLMGARWVDVPRPV
jgi:hypothetical protein